MEVCLKSVEEQVEVILNNTKTCSVVSITLWLLTIIEHPFA